MPGEVWDEITASLKFGNGEVISLRVQLLIHARIKVNQG